MPALSPKYCREFYVLIMNDLHAYQVYAVYVFDTFGVRFWADLQRPEHASLLNVCDIYF